jgi:hypothetical protein
MNIVATDNVEIITKSAVAAILTCDYFFHPELAVSFE